MRTVLPVSPGEMLEEEFLKPLGLSRSTALQKTSAFRRIESGKSSLASALSLLTRTFGFAATSD